MFANYVARSVQLVLTTGLSRGVRLPGKSPPFSHPICFGRQESNVSLDWKSYVGGFSGDHLAVSGSEISQQSQYLATGSGLSMLANRISWFYDLRGLSFTIDTACSSSMVALHEACRELQDGSSSMVSAA